MCSRRAGIQSELLKAQLDDAAHPALSRLLRRVAARGAGGPGILLRWTARRRRLRLVPIVAVECPAQPLQLEN